MGKRFAWPWVVGALIVGWLVGEERPKKNSVPTLEGVTIVRKSDRVIKPTNTTTPTKLKTPAKTTSLPKKIEPIISNIKPTEMYVDASRLNVRTGPDKSYKLIWTLKRDEKVFVITRKGEWAFLKDKRYEGWVHGGFLTPNKSPAAAIVSLQNKSEPKSQLSTAKIKKLLIQRSISYYRGNCPCPYNVKSNGHSCGGNSAWSRPGGESPLCYDSDISAAMVAEYRARQ